MKQSWLRAAALLLTAGVLSPGQAEEITVMISGGFSAALDNLAVQYQQKTGDTLDIVRGPSMGNSPQAIPRRLAAGEKADVVIMVGYALDKLMHEGLLVEGSRTELADSRIGMVVRDGAPVPDISSVSALRATLLRAKSIAYSDSASGRYVGSRLFKVLGVEEQVRGRAQMIEKTPVALRVAEGKAQIGFQQVSELLPVKGAHFVGRLPGSVQYVTRFAGAVVRDGQHTQHARRLLAWLASPEAQAQVQKSGMDPLGASADTSR